MTASQRALEAQFLQAIKDGAEVQVFLQGIGAVGPGPVTLNEAAPPTSPDWSADGPIGRCYTIDTPVQVPGPVARFFRAPLSFTFDNVMAFTGPPVDEEGRPIVVRPTGRSGLITPR